MKKPKSPPLSVLDMACFAPREGGVVKCGAWTEAALSALSPRLRRYS